MAIRVLLFASYADALGAKELELELPARATVAQVLAEVRSRAAQLGARALPNALVAVNEEYATPDQIVADRDEVAVIPPVAGG